MVLDCHVHSAGGEYLPDDCIKKMKDGGVDGGIVFSLAPGVPDDSGMIPEYRTAERRLEQVLDFTKDRQHLYPFYYINPLEDGAFEQVDKAVEAGIKGFKVICGRHYPQDDQAMRVWEYIAQKNKPILFHSGILYGLHPSTEFNRPGNFEHLFAIKNLKFAMAHISWPWCDELIAVYGKWNSLKYERNAPVSSELYIDMAPGTPAIYREDALTKLVWFMNVWPSLADRVMFGTDCNTNYNGQYANTWINCDNYIYDKLSVPEELREKIFSKNLLSFVGA